MIDRYLIVHVLLIIVSGVLSEFVCLCSPFMNWLAATIECGKYICCRQLSCPSVECWCCGSIRRYTRLESDDEERFSSYAVLRQLSSSSISNRHRGRCCNDHSDTAHISAEAQASHARIEIVKRKFHSARDLASRSITTEALNRSSLV